jgi:hypothetical protein
VPFFLLISVLCSSAVDIRSSIEEDFFIYVNIYRCSASLLSFLKNCKVFFEIKLSCDFDLIVFCTYLCDIIVRVMSFTMLCLVLQKMCPCVHTVCYLICFV